MRSKVATDWLDSGFKSDFELCKDETLKCELKTHGQWVTFIYSDGDPDENIFAYFERDHQELTLDAEVAYSTNEPMVECRYADFEKVPNKGDQVRVIEQFGDESVFLNMLFEICERKEPDEQGAMMFKLELIDATRTTANP